MEMTSFVEIIIDSYSVLDLMQLLTRTEREFLARFNWTCCQLISDRPLSNHFPIRQVKFGEGWFNITLSKGTLLITVQPRLSWTDNTDKKSKIRCTFIDQFLNSVKAGWSVEKSKWVAMNKHLRDFQTNISPTTMIWSAIIIYIKILLFNELYTVL